MLIPKLCRSGELVDLADFREEDVTLVDLCVLEDIPRFGGAVHWTVADHSLALCGYCLRYHSEIIAACALTHDLAEAYIGDLHGPLKVSPGFAAYRNLEDRIQATIERALGLRFSPEVKAFVSELDKRMTELELRRFWPDVDLSVLGQRPEPLDFSNVLCPSPFGPVLLRVIVAHGNGRIT